MPWSRKWQPTPVVLPGRLHGQRSLEGYFATMGFQRLGTQLNDSTQAHSFQSLKLSFSLLVNILILSSLLAFLSSTSSPDPSSSLLYSPATSHHGQIILYSSEVQPAPVWCPVLQMRDWRPAKYFLSWDDPETLLHKWETNPRSVTLISAPLIKTLLTFLAVKSRMWVGCVGSGACLWLICEQCLKYFKILKFNQRDCKLQPERN